MVTRRSVLAGAALCLAPLKLLAAPDLGGTWTGVLNVGSQRLRLKCEMTAGGEVTLYSLDQDNKPISGRVSKADGHVQIKFKALRATYTGRQTGDDRMDGLWQQGLDIPLTLMRGEQGLIAANIAAPALDQAGLDSMRRAADAPALVAAASVRGGRDQIWVSGTRGIGRTAAVTPHDQWHLGSISKCMTATLVARLVEAGAVTWDTRVVDLLGKTVPNMHDAYRTVSFRHLLSHRAGMPENIPMAQFVSFVLRESEEVRGQRVRFAQLALKMNPIGPRESTYQYSNNDYIVAAAMLEAALDQSWEDLIHTHLFRPLGLQSAGFGPPDAGLVGELQQPIGHMADLESRLLSLFGMQPIRGVRPGLGTQADNPKVLGPAGRVHMTLTDLLTYLNAHRDGSALLRQDTWQTLHTPPFGGDYAMGWIVRSDGSLWHNGSNNRWYAEVIFNPQTGTAATAASNDCRAKATSAVGNTLLRAESAAIRS